MTRLSQLPPNVVVHILRCVPLADKLSSCALVCSDWAAAAAQATDTITIEFDTQAATHGQASLQRYLEAHGQHVLELTMSVDALSVPIEVLGHAATGLTYLDCSAPQLPGGAASLTALAALTNLRELSLAIDDDSPAVGPPSEVVPASALGQLVQLTALLLQGTMGIDTLRPLSALSQLQSLSVQLLFGLVEGAVASSGSAMGLLPAPEQQQGQEQQQLQRPRQQGQEHERGRAQLPQPSLQHLTELRLFTPRLEVSSSGGAGGLSFSGCTALRSLALSQCSFDPALLQSMPLLECLELDSEVTLQGGGVTALLHGISGLQHLEELTLVGLQPLAPAAACAALTSSSKLQYLLLTTCTVAPGFWQHVFRPGCCLAALTTVIVQDHRGALLDSQGLQSLVRFCPALCSLTLRRTLEPGVDLRPLMQLPQLQDLRLNGVTDADTLSLAKLTRLRVLEVSPPSTISTQGLYRLTSLLGLQRLEVYREFVREQPVTFENKAAEGSPPDVWYQLLCACTADPLCQQALLHNRDELLQRMQAAGLDTRLVEDAIEVARARAAFEEAMSRLAMRRAGVNTPLLWEP